MKVNIIHYWYAHTKKSLSAYSKNSPGFHSCSGNIIYNILYCHWCNSIIYKINKFSFMSSLYDDMSFLIPEGKTASCFTLLYQQFITVVGCDYIYHDNSLVNLDSTCIVIQCTCLHVCLDMQCPLPSMPAVPTEYLTLILVKLAWKLQVWPHFMDIIGCPFMGWCYSKFYKPSWQIWFLNQKIHQYE